MAQALYRKYRSRSLGEVIGQEHITRTLQQALNSGHINHAYLLTGPRGTGKTSIARILAFEINNLPYSDSPNLDIIEIDAASNRRIDDIRDLREKVHISPISAKYKVYIIDEVHMLTGESFNALLKTLEEPPSHVVFILATTEAHKLPATIISRTQRFSLRPIEDAKVIKHLRYIADKEGIKIKDDALELIANNGDGCLRDCVGLLDQVAHISSDEISASDIENALGLAPKNAVTSLAESAANGDQATALKILQNFSAQNYSDQALVGQLSKELIKLAPNHTELYDLLDKLVDVPRSYMPGVKLLSVILTHINSKHKKNTNVNAALTSNTSAPVVAETPLKVVRATQDLQKKSQKNDAPTEQLSEDTPKQASEIILTDFDTKNWDTLLASVKKSNAPLFSVLKQGQPVFDTDNSTLTIKFKYTLHGKKLDDPKQKALLTEIMQSTLGGAPTIKVEIDKNATPGAASDPMISSVASIMGGGEVVDGQSI